jgi:hypothetical protein
MGPESEAAPSWTDHARMRSLLAPMANFMSSPALLWKSPCSVRQLSQTVVRLRATTERRVTLWAPGGNLYVTDATNSNQVMRVDRTTGAPLPVPGAPAGSALFTRGAA